VSTIDLYVNGVKVATPAFTQTPTLSDWAINQQNVILNAGNNTIEFKANGAAASSVYFDGIVVIPTVYGDGLVIQENSSGFDSVDGTIDNNYPGYTGVGYANTDNTKGAGINWSAYFDSSTVKSLTFRYSSTNNSTADLIIDGTNVVSNIQFPSSGSFSNWSFATVYPYITPGGAAVRLQSSSAAGLPNIDYVELMGGTAGNSPPSLTPIADQVTGAEVTLIITNTASDTDLPAQTLTFNLLMSPINATINTNSGVLTWRPFVTQANSTNSFTVVVADNGIPSLSATQSFSVTVNPLAQPQLSVMSWNGSQLALQVNGDSGPDYQVQSSTNLSNWDPVFTANSPPMPFLWTNSATGSPINFFRVIAGPPFP